MRICCNIAEVGLIKSALSYLIDLHFKAQLIKDEKLYLIRNVFFQLVTSKGRLQESRGAELTWLLFLQDVKRKEK